MPSPTLGRARRWAHRALDVVFPPRCVGCRRLGHWLCPRCRPGAGSDALTICARCYVPIGGAALLCPACPGWRAGHVATVTSAGTYGDVLKQAVFALKYHRRQAIAPTLAEVLLPAVRPLMRPGDVFVPVPLHPSRERERGYNQAALLARALAAALLLDGAGAFAVRDDLLLRGRATADQTRLGPEERRRNMAGAFALAPARAAYPPAGRLWLVDDVVTTGATLDACAGALRALDLPVHGLALARAPGGLGRRVRPT